MDETHPATFRPQLGLGVLWITYCTSPCVSKWLYFEWLERTFPFSTKSRSAHFRLFLSPCVLLSVFLPPTSRTHGLFLKNPFVCVLFDPKAALKIKLECFQCISKQNYDDCTDYNAASVYKWTSFRTVQCCWPKHKLCVCGCKYLAVQIFRLHHPKTKFAGHMT